MCNLKKTQRHPRSNGRRNKLVENNESQLLVPSLPQYLYSQRSVTCHLVLKVNEPQTDWQSRFPPDFRVCMQSIRPQKFISTFSLQENLALSAAIRARVLLQPYTNISYPTRADEIVVKVVLWSKNHFLFFIRFWKRVRLTPNWQNFELWVLSEGCLFWV